MDYINSLPTPFKILRHKSPVAPAMEIKHFDGLQHIGGKVYDKFEELYKNGTFADIEK